MHTMKQQQAHLLLAGDDVPWSHPPLIEVAEIGWARRRSRHSWAALASRRRMGHLHSRVVWLMGMRLLPRRLLRPCRQRARRRGRGR